MKICIGGGFSNTGGGSDSIKQISDGDGCDDGWDGTLPKDYDWITDGITKLKPGFDSNNERHAKVWRSF